MTRAGTVLALMDFALKQRTPEWLEGIIHVSGGWGREHAWQEKWPMQRPWGRKEQLKGTNSSGGQWGMGKGGKRKCLRVGERLL